MMASLAIFVTIMMSLCRGLHTESDCSGPPMSLSSDNPRRTCFKLEVSNNLLVYSCDSLIKSFEKPLIKYCPVEICLPNGTWTAPSLSCAMAECYDEGHSDKYLGHRICTKSGRPCQRWDRQEPHRHRFKTSEMFPDATISMAESFCRDPGGNKGAPWCNTLDPDKKWEFCDVKICSKLPVRDYFCGKTSFDPDDIVTADPTQSHTKASTTQTARTSSSTDEQTTTSDVINPSRPCGVSGVRFKTKDKVAAREEPFRSGTARSNLECASLCTANRECKTFTFNKDAGLCSFFDSFELKTKRESGTKTSVKQCY